MDQGNPSVAAPIINPVCKWHMPGGEELTGIEVFKESDGQFRKGFGNIHHRVEDLITEGDKVAARIKKATVYEGTYSGDKSSGNELMVTVIAIYKFRHGKIIESRLEYDALGLMQKVGGVK